MNSYDEAEVMTIMTSVPHEFGAYKGMTGAARMLMEHKELATAIRNSQFSDSNDWVNILYSPISDLTNEKLGLMDKMKKAQDNISQFIKNYSSPMEVESFKQARLIADKKTIEMIQQVIMYNNNTETFEEIEQKTGKHYK